MRIVKRAAAASIGAALLVAGLPAWQAHAQEIPAPAETLTGASPSVTLITGDRVLLREDGSPWVLPAAGREDMPFQTETVDGKLTVLPQDAARLIAEGRVDQRLFDVTGLLSAGYGDAERDTIPLIVDRAPGPGLAAAQSERSLSTVDVLALEVRKGEQAAWASIVDGSASGVRKLWLDGKRTPFLDHTVGAIGAPAAWSKGFDGTGIKVAVLDTGVDETHPDLAGQVIEERDFSGAGDADTVGHGTHVAATIASKDAKFRGVAPGAKILDGKVCGSTQCSDSAILEGMHWAVERGAKVVNLSLGSTDTPEVDPLEEAVNTLSRKHGTLFVIAAGNSGKNDTFTTIGTPSTADEALSVAATELNGATANFSSRGPRPGDHALKPEISAPGVGVTAAASTTAFPGRGRISMNGTSMATPHVAGAAAVLAQAHPDWTGAQLKSALIGTANPQTGAGVFDQGAGRTDVARAVGQSITASPATVSFGLEAFPHHDDTPKTKEITYRNPGAADVTLALSVRTLGPDGKPGPAGMFTVDKTAVVVPAGGAASVTVTSDTRVAAPDGLFSAHLIGKADGVQVVTPIGVNREGDTHELTMRFTDPAGVIPDSVRLTLFNFDKRRTYTMGARDATTVRLPAGEYFIHASITAKDRNDRSFYNVYAPKITLGAAKTLDFDARTTGSASITQPDPNAALKAAINGVVFNRHGWKFIASSQHHGLDKIKSAVIGEPIAAGELTNSVILTSLAQNGERYAMAYTLPDRIPAGFTKVVGHADLAVIHNRLGNAPKGMAMNYSFALRHPDFSISLPNVLIRDTQPDRTQIEHVTANTWRTDLHIRTRGEHVLFGAPKTTEVGRTYHESPGIGVFGPSLRSASATRTGNTMKAAPALMAGEQGGGGTVFPNTGYTELFRNGESIYRKQRPADLNTTVAAEEASYRLVTRIEHAIRPTSSKQAVEWTFRSGATPTDEPTTLPLSVARFTPELDQNNMAPAGVPMFMPVTIHGHPGSAAGAMKEVVLEVSFDDGATWRRLPYIPQGPPFNTVFHNPREGFVSLRASGTDVHGNTFKQTLIRAYGVE